MRLNIHDFSGHPFQVQLSRELAARGHEVLHGFSTQYVTGHGRLTVGPDDPPGLRIEGITASAPMVKYSAIGRTRFELRYATAWQRALRDETFDLVVACNVPLFTLARMRHWFARRNQPWALWHQDVYSLGVAGEATRKLPGPLADLAGVWVQRVERRQIQKADTIVAITDSMVRQYEEWGVQRDGVHVVPNWAPLDEIVPAPRDNAWTAELGLPTAPLRLVYAGTLGRKHNPTLLLDVLDGCKARGLDVVLVVVSEGLGADELAVAANGRPDVLQFGFQPAERFAEVLGSADAVVALLEPDAARFSVPSKVMSYLSAGRPVVALLPDGNPVAADVRATGGFVGTPDHNGVTAAVEWICDTSAYPEGFEAAGLRARNFATTHFDIKQIADRFEEIFGGIVSAQPVERISRSRR